MSLQQDKLMSFFPHDFIFQIQNGNNEDRHHPDTFTGGSMMMKRSMSFSEPNHRFVEGDGFGNQEDELSDECVGGGGGEKKKRLKREQVRELERSFELGNKLEAERKQQLAKSLGLQPRQVAIWFQNRRARWKTKQLEKDYGFLKKQFETAMAENDKLQSQNKQLHQELQALRSRGPILERSVSIKKEAAGGRHSWSNTASERSCEINLLESSRTPTSMNLFPSSFIRPATMTHLLETSLRSDPQPLRINQVIPEESFNMLCGVGDQAGLWPWPEQHHFGQ